MRNRHPLGIAFRQYILFLIPLTVLALLNVVSLILPHLTPVNVRSRVPDIPFCTQVSFVPI